MYTDPSNLIAVVGDYWTRFAVISFSFDHKLDAIRRALPCDCDVHTATNASL
jgi:hypothetical protein